MTLKYVLYLPPAYETQPDTRWPLVLFLHGAGERGDNLELLNVHGLPKLITLGRHFPFLVVAPQCPQGIWWDTDALIRLLDEVEGLCRVDPDRVYVTGLSMGGYGTWALAIAQPDRFAAIVPICGGADPKLACTLKSVPVWAFHGAKDEIVPLEASAQMVEALRACGGNVQFTVYPECGHDSWTETYNNPALYEWLLAQTRAAQAK